MKAKPCDRAEIKVIGTEKKEEEEKGNIRRKLNVIFFKCVLMDIEWRLVLHQKANQVLP